MKEGRKDLTMRKGQKGKRKAGRKRKKKYTKVEVEEVTKSDKAGKKTPIPNFHFTVKS